MQIETANGKPVAKVLPAVTVTNPGLTLEQAQEKLKEAQALVKAMRNKPTHIHAVESTYTDNRTGKVHPTIIIKTTDEEKEYKPFTFGLSKAKLLLSPGIMQAVQQFVSKHDGK